MLWYKAWVESRTRFLLIAVCLTLFCAAVVLFHGQTEPVLTDALRGLRTRTFSEHIYKLIYSGTAKGMFAILVIFLGLGGLGRERTHGTAIFTLALPATRFQMVATQMAVGLLELAALSLLPALLIPALSALVQQYYPFTQALHFAVLWFCCGSIIFAASFLLSVMLEGEYTAPVACFLVMMLDTLVSGWRPIIGWRLNLMWIMGDFNTMHWGPGQNLLVSPPLPWARLAVIVSVTLCMLAAAVRSTQKQDF
jgi:ABC-2 type transport system permease protein